jgi:hypothetical protein
MYEASTIQIVKEFGSFLAVGLTCTNELIEAFAMAVE